MTILERGVNGTDNYFVQDLPICKNAIQVQCNKASVIVIMHQFAYFGKGRTTLPNLQFAIQMDDDSNGYLPVLDGKSLSKNREHILCVLHLGEYCSKIPWIIQSDVPLKGELSQGELVMTLNGESYLKESYLKESCLKQNCLKQNCLKQSCLKQCCLKQCYLKGILL